MNEWINLLENQYDPDYNWVLVASQRDGSGEPCPWAIARLTSAGWDFLGSLPFMCPAGCDQMDEWNEEDEITHYMKIPYLRSFN